MEYLEFTKSNDYSEQDKFEFFKRTNKLLSAIDETNAILLLSEVKPAGTIDKNFAYFMDALVAVAKENPKQFWSELSNLYRNRIDLADRIDRFEKYAAPLIEKKTTMGKADLRNISLLLAIYDSSSYPIYKSKEFRGIGGKNPVDGVLSKIGISKMKFNDVGQSYFGRGYSIFFSFCTELLVEMKKCPELASANMLTVQDFIHVVGSDFYGHGML